MLNYMKSECYRIFHSGPFYIMTAVMAGLTLCINLILFYFGQTDPDFPYATFRFSLNNLTAVPSVIIAMGGFVPGVLLTADRKSGVVKTAVGYGIPRAGLLIGKCTVGFLAAFSALVIILTVYVGSAYLLLDHPEWQPFREMLSAIGATLPSAVASLVWMIVLVTLCSSEFMAAIIWAGILYFLPKIFFFLGLKILFFYRISEWMIANIFTYEVSVTFSEYHCLWDTPDGLAKCLIAGTIGIVVFMSYGIIRFRKCSL